MLVLPLKNKSIDLTILLIGIALFTMPFVQYGPLRPSNYLLLLVFLFAVIKSTKALWVKTLKNPFVIWSSVYLIIKLIFLFSSGNFEKSDYITVDLMLLLFPLFYTLLSPTKTDVHFFELMFLCGVIFSSFFVFSDGLSFLQGGMDTKLMEEKLVMHRPYYGLFILSALIICLQYFLSSKKTSKLVFGAFVYLSLYLFFIYAKIAIIAYFIICFLAFIYYFRNQFKSAKFRRFILIGITSLVAVCIAFFFIMDADKFQLLIQNSFSERIKIWSCSLDQFHGASELFFGTGIGQENELIKDCFIQKNWDVVNYNAHNQFISDTMSYGILGFLSLLSFYLFSFYQGIKKRQLKFILFIGVFLLASLTESVFHRITGVVLFATIGSIYFNEFYYSTPTKPKEN